ncbi:MFS transporter [Escherichia coli]
MLHNKLLWYIAIANAFVYLIRYGVLDWAPTYLKEARISLSTTPPGPISWYQWAGIPGTLLCGWISDKMFQGRRAPAGILFMVLVTVAVLVYWLNPAGNPTVDMLALVAIGFLIDGPVYSSVRNELELAPKKAAGTAAGFTGLFGDWGGRGGQRHAGLYR